MGENNTAWKLSTYGVISDLHFQSEYRNYETEIIWTLLRHCKSFINNTWLENVWEKNPTIALAILYTKEKEILPPCISKQSANHEKQIILLMIPNKEK